MQTDLRFVLHGLVSPQADEKFASLGEKKELLEKSAPER